MREHVTGAQRSAPAERGSRQAGRRPAVPAAPAVSAAPAPGRPRSPGEVTALQRSVGNAAVARMMEQERHAHGPGCAADHGTAVQRAPLNLTREGQDGAGRQPLDSDQADDVFDYALTSLAKGNHEAVELLLKRLAELSPVPAYLDALRTAVAGNHADDRPRIPPEVHFIWIGQPISKPALDQIVSWAARAQNSDWIINLWTDRKSTWRTGDTLRVRLTGKLKFRSIEEALDDRVREIYTTATTGNQKAYPLASDIARYSILKKHGGVYADVDLGSGDIDLQRTKPQLRDTDVPVLGPLIRDSKSLKGTLDTAGAGHASGLPVGDQVRIAAQYLLDTGGYGNHFIAAQKNSAVMDRMIAKVAADTSGMDAEELHMVGPAATGPFGLIKVVDQHLSEEFGVESLRTGEHALFQTAGRQFHEHIQWLTTESENQNY
ncbi:glycosyltransferase [Kitasatospora sp. NPDC085464]|uniref:glycosyltransferase n=1 Tax=Kitasatospora sp. NPDC085464 TaxID=3364063 RepID=UPI0037CBD091